MTAPTTPSQPAAPPPQAGGAAPVQGEVVRLPPAVADRAASAGRALVISGSVTATDGKGTATIRLPEGEAVIRLAQPLQVGKQITLILSLPVAAKPAPQAPQLTHPRASAPALATQAPPSPTPASAPSTSAQPQLQVLVTGPALTPRPLSELSGTRTNAAVTPKPEVPASQQPATATIRAPASQQPALPPTPATTVGLTSQPPAQPAANPGSNSPVPPAVAQQAPIAGIERAQAPLQRVVQTPPAQQPGSLTPGTIPAAANSTPVEKTQALLPPRAATPVPHTPTTLVPASSAKTVSALPSPQPAATGNLNPALPANPTIGAAAADTPAPTTAPQPPTTRFVSASTPQQRQAPAPSNASPASPQATADRAAPANSQPIPTAPTARPVINQPTSQPTLATPSPSPHPATAEAGPKQSGQQQAPGPLTALRAAIGKFTSPVGQPNTVAASPLTDSIEPFPTLKMSTLAELTEVIAQIDPGALSQGRAPTLPQPGPQLTASMMFFLAALRGGTARTWIGDRAAAALDAAGATDLTARLTAEFSGSARAMAEPPPGDWRSLSIPFQHGQQVHEIRLHYHPDDGPSGDDDEADTGKRIMVDFTLSKSGPMRLDGLLREKRFDLIIRSLASLPDWMRGDITCLFGSACEATGLAGSVTFKTGKQGWVAVRDVTGPEAGLSRLA